MNTCARAILIVSASAFALLSTANAADMPKRKSGLWEITTQSEGQGGMTMQMCVDEKQDDLNARQGKDAANDMRKQCTKMDVKRSGNKVEIDSICKINNVTATGHTIISGDMTSQYQMDSNTRFDPPMHGMAQSHTSMTGKWLGPCKQGQAPGSMSIKGMPGGGNFQMTPEMMKQMKKMQQQYGH
jgi:hypothetical protein